ncbi:MAG TPA: tetratricopeptide repeat protein [Ktedonobacterales bacterium]
MEKLRKFLNISSWQEFLATTDVWATRFMLLAFFVLAFGSAAQAPTEATNLQAGLAAQGQQEYWRAESFFEQAALLAPDDYQPSLDLARLHLLEHQDNLARSELATAQRLQPDNADIWLALGDVAQDQGNPQEAEQSWLQATHLNPAAAMQAHERLGLLYEQQGRLQDAEVQFAALPGGDTLAQYQLGVLRLERGDRAAARQAFEAALNQTSGNTQRNAARSFLQAIDQWNGSAQSDRFVGLTYIENHLPAFAAASLKQAIALAPNDANAHAYLSWVYLQSNAASQAQQEALQAVKLDPRNSFARYVLSLLALADGSYSSAINNLEQALATDPRDPVLWATRASIAEQLGDAVTAEQALRQAATNAGSDPQYSLLLATFYADHQIGLSDETALAAAQEAVALAPTNGLAYDVLGRIEQAMNDFSAALNAFLQAANFAPTNASIHVHLGNLQASLGYLRSAELNLHKAIVLDFNGPTARQAQQLLQGLPALGV